MQFGISFPGWYAQHIPAAFSPVPTLGLLEGRREESTRGVCGIAKMRL